jgi:lipoprotein-releasing system permease protein
MLPPLPEGSWLERQRNIIDFAIKGLLRHSMKNSLIMAMFVIIVFVISSILFITGSLTAELLVTSHELPGITVQKIQGGRQTNIQDAYLEPMTRIPGIESIEPRIWGYFYLEALKANFTIFGMDLSLLEDGEYREIVDWLPDKTNSGKNNNFRMIVGEGVHQLLKSQRMSETFLFFQPQWERAVPFDIVGIFDSATQLQSNDLMVLQLEGARQVLAVPEGQYTDFAVSVPNPEEIDTVALKIRRFYPELRTITKSQIQRSYNTVFSWKSGVVTSSLMIVVLAFLILIWDKASGLSPSEKQEVGILKAIGWDTDMVLAVKFWENVILSLGGFLLGVVFAYIFIYELNAPGLKAIFIGWSKVYPDFDLVPVVDFKLLLLILFLTVLPYCSIAILPAWKAAVTDPDQIIRNLG